MPLTKTEICHFSTLSAIIFLTGFPSTSLQRSAQFHAVQWGGRPQCCTDPPALTQRARSSLECSTECVGQDGESCAAFNFKQNQSRCDLSGAAANYNFTEIPGCTLYQVSTTIVYFVICILLNDSIRIQNIKTLMANSIDDEIQ